MLQKKFFLKCLKKNLKNQIKNLDKNEKNEKSEKKRSDKSMYIRKRGFLFFCRRFSKQIVGGSDLFCI